MSNEPTKWPAPIKSDPSGAGAALRQYEQQTTETTDEPAAYQRTLARIDRSAQPSSHARWFVAFGATALVVPVLLWLLRSSPAVPVIPGPRASAPVATATAEVPPHATTPEPSVLLGPVPTPLPTGKIRLGDGITASLSATASATARFQEGTLDITLASGELVLHVPPREIGQAVLVTAGGYRLTVVGTVLTVSHGPRRLDLTVREGLVAVSKDGGHLATVAAGETWSTALPVPDPRRFAPRISRSTPATDCTRFAVDTRDTRIQERLRCYREKARGRGPKSERAQYELACLLRDGRGDLAAALSAFELQRARFPQGDHRSDADRAIIELLPRLGRHAEALAETQMFLDEHPDSESRAEIRLVRGDIYRAIFRDVTSAEREYDEGTDAQGRTGDDSRFLRALCLEALGRMDEALVAYQEYLAQSGTAHAREAKRRMEELAR